MAKTLIKSLTASSSSSLDFVDGTSDVVMDSTYPVYEFHFVNIHPATDNVNFTFQVNATDDAGGGYDTSQITSAVTAAYHKEDGGGGYYIYESGFDQANGTGYQHIGSYVGYDNDQACSGVLTLYDPSSTTYIKHFTSNINIATRDEYSRQLLAAGYINDTTAIDEISFKFSSGNIDAGTIKMFGVS